MSHACHASGQQQQQPGAAAASGRRRQRSITHHTNGPHLPAQVKTAKNHTPGFVVHPICMLPSSTVAELHSLRERKGFTSVCVTGAPAAPAAHRSREGRGGGRGQALDARAARSGCP